MSFTELAGLPLVLPGSPAKDLIAAGHAYGVLPVSACGREIGDGRLRYAPLHAQALTHRLGIAASSQLELPRELAAKIGDIIREETGRLIKSGAWPARFLAPHRRDPNQA